MCAARHWVRVPDGLSQGTAQRAVRRCRRGLVVRGLSRAALRLGRGLRARGQPGPAADLRLLHRPIDHRRWGQSSWLNYWQGRDEGLWDEGLWAAAVGDTGHEGPSTNSTHHQRVLGDS